MANKKSSIANAWQRVLCLVVSLAMVLSLAGCFSIPLDFLESLSTGTQSTTSSTTQGTQPTMQPTDATPSTQGTEPTSGTEPTQGTEPTGSTEPTGGTEPSEPPVTEEDELVYILTQADVDNFYILLEELEALALAGEDLDAIDTAMELVDDSYAFLDEQCSIALILHYSHTDDADLEKQYLDTVEICTQANDAYVQMTKRLYQSDSPAKEHLFEGWTEEDFDSLMSYNEQIAVLQQRNAEIGVEYRATEDDDRKIELYIEFVQNNNQIAAYYGYDSYYTYAYEVSYDRDYDADAVEQLREYAQEYLAGTFEDALMNFYYSYYVDLPSSGQREVENFLYNDYNHISKNYVSAYLNALPESMAEPMRAMLEKDSLFTNASDAMPGAFTTYIGERSYCYFGPGYGNTMTVIHEGGHYYASRYANIMNIPLDLAETHSQGNEWLFLSFLDGNMTANRYDALVDYQLYDCLAMILICLMVDEFEQIVYTTDLTGFTASDFDAIMNEVSLQYFPDGDVQDMLTDVNYYWRAVVVDQPVYYISYAVSAMAAVSLYTVAEEDFDAAVEAYRKLCEEPVMEEGFLGNIQSAGLLSPFDETFYQLLKQLVSNRA